MVSASIQLLSVARQRDKRHKGHRCKVGVLPHFAFKRSNKTDIQRNVARTIVFLAAGSLLGVVRDQGQILAHEFDTDIGLMIQDCPRMIDALRIAVRNAPQESQQRHYHIYSQQDYVPGKGSWLLGYSSYLHAPCARVYDKDIKYYTDIYWYREVSAQKIRRQIEVQMLGKSLHDENAALAEGQEPHSDAEHEITSQTTATNTESGETGADAETRHVVTPEGYNALTDGPLICNDEGYTGEIPGGCKLKTDLFPLKQAKLASGESVTIPNHPEHLLESMYGSTWRTPLPKGYKAVVCAVMPRPWLIYAMLFSALAGAIAYAKFGLQMFACCRQPKPQLRYTQL